MNYSITPNSVIGHLLPGAFFLLVLLALIFGTNMELQALKNVPELSTVVAIGSGAFLLAAWFTGLFFDALRNFIVDHFWDRWSKYNRQHNCSITWWDIFFKGDEQTVKNLNDHYYSYYVLDVNLAIANFFLLLNRLLKFAKIHEPRIRLRTR